MQSLDAVPAVRRIETTRADCSAFEVFGHVTSADVENLFGLLEGAYALNDRIDLLIRLVDHDGIDWVDVSPETLSQGRAMALNHVKRCAAVGEPNWIPQVQGLFSRIEVELKHFALANEAEAWAWLGAQPAEDAS